MKRWISLLLTLCLLVGMAQGAAAEEAPGARTLFAPGEITSMALGGETLYLSGGNTLYAYRDGELGEVCAMPEGDYLLIDGEEGVLALETQSGAVGTIENGVFTQTLALDYAPMKTADGVMMIYGLCRAGDTLCVLALDAKTYTAGQEFLVRFDLQTGEAQRDSLTYALSIAAYDGTVMALHQDVARMTRGETGMALDTLTADAALDQTIIANTDYQTGAMAQAPDGTVYMSGGGQLKRVEDGTLKNVCALGVSSGVNASARIVGNTYVVLCAEGVLAAAMEESEAAVTLTIVGGSMDDTAVRFMQEHPDIALNFDARQITGSQGVREDMEAGTGVDIYIVHELLGLRALIDKGYVAEITSEALTADAARMYPAIQDAILRDGKLYAYPQMFNLNCWTLNRTAWNEVYGVDTPVPETFDAFFDCIEEWDEEYADAYPEYQFTQIYYGWQQLLSTVLEQYALMHAADGAALQFDSADFVSALERLSGMELETIEIGETLTEETIAQLQAILMKPSMIEVMATGSLLASNVNSDETVREAIAPMVFHEGETPAIRADLMAYVVNPASKNLDAAMTYLEYAAAHQGGDMKVMLFEDETQPARPADYDRWVEEGTQELDELRSRLAQEQEETEKADIQAEIDEIEARLADMEANEWLASPEGIAAYKRLAPYMTLGSAVSFLYGGGDQASATQELSNLLNRFIEGQMTAQQLVKELDKKIAMIYLEGN